MTLHACTRCGSARMLLVHVAPGDVCGCRHIGWGYSGDELKIELIHPQQIHPGLEGQETGDYIKIFGDPDIRISITCVRVPVLRAHTEAINIEFHGLGLDWVDKYPGKIRALTLDEANRAARERLHPGQYVMVVMGNVKKDDLGLSDVEWIE